MARFRIDTLYHGGWTLFELPTSTNSSPNGIGMWPSCIVASATKWPRRFCQHVDVSCGRLLPLAEFRDPDIMTMPEYCELRAIERTLADITRQIDLNSVFYDSRHELLTTIGISRQDMQNLIDGQTSPGYIPCENVEKLLTMVVGAKQQVIGDADDAKFYRHKRRELVQFLQRALLVGEPLFCDL